MKGGTTKGAELGVLDVRSHPLDEGVTMVEASAGTGKTFTLVQLAIRLLLEKKVDSIDKLLIVTFTNAATAELRTRLRTRLVEAVDVFAAAPGDDKTDPILRELRDRHGADGLTILRDALTRFDEVSVHTIHGFCAQVLESSAFESGNAFDKELVDDESDLVAEALHDFWRQHVAAGDALPAAFLSATKRTPAAFAPGLHAMREEPEARVWPPPPEIDRALAQLHKTWAGIADAWRADRSLAWLDDLRFSGKFKQQLSDGLRDGLFRSLERLLEPAEEKSRERAFPGGMQAVAAVLQLSSKGLAAGLTDKGEIEFEPGSLTLACDTCLRAVDDYVYALRIQMFRDVTARVAQLKQQRGLASYRDLLVELRSALRDSTMGDRLARSLANRYQAALVDEFQDTDSTQWEIFERVFAKHRLYLIGDPKQAIYGFRGADLDTYLHARESADRRTTLSTNYRSRDVMVKAVNAVFSRQSDPFLEENIEFRPAEAAKVAERPELSRDDGRALEWIVLDAISNKEVARTAIAERVSREIQNLLGGQAALGDRSVAPGDIAVLVRGHREASAVRECLAEVGISAVVSKSGNIFLSDEMLDIRTLLAAIASPADPVAIRAACATRVIGHAAHDVRDTEELAQGWQRRADDFARYRETLVDAGAGAAFETLFHDFGVRTRILSAHGGLRRATNLLHCIEILEQRRLIAHNGPEALVEWVDREIATAGDGGASETVAAEARELRLETDREAVRIATVHAAKGLEYEIVFCPFLWSAHTVTLGDTEPIRPLRLREAEGFVHAFGVQDNSAEHLQCERQQLAEDLRLAYVALTRAKQRCVILTGLFGKKPQELSRSALGWLLHAEKRSDVDPDSGWKQRLPVGEPDTAAIREDVDAFVARHPQLSRTRPSELPPAERPLHTPSSGIAAPPLAPRTFPDTPSPLGRMLGFTSFSRLTSGTRGGDDAVDQTEQREHRDPALVEPAEDVAPSGIFAFARGTRAGQCLHDVFEHASLDDPSDDRSRNAVQDALTRHRLGSESPEHSTKIDAPAVVAKMLEDVVTASIPAAEFCLRDISPERRRAEWPFYLPIHLASPARIADVFRKFPSEAIPRDYAKRVDRLGAHRIDGWLTGIIDLLFEHAGKWYVLDWKSNWLGAQRADYQPEAIEQSMREHDYFLQYHLYTLAVHRFLRARVPDYDYATHFGGVLYAFVRGISPRDTAPGSKPGWFFEMPPAPRIHALDELAGGGTP